jgi:hypothetical protein
MKFSLPAIATILAITLLIGCSATRRSPSHAEVRAYVESLVRKDYQHVLTVNEIKHETFPDQSPDRMLVKFRATLELMEPLFQPTEMPSGVSAAMTDSDVADIRARVANVAEILNEKPASLSGDFPADPFANLFVKVATAKGAKVTMNGSLVATRNVDSWSFRPSLDLESLASWAGTGDLEGSPRSAFGKAIDVESMDQLEQVRRQLNAWQSIANELEPLEKRAERHLADIRAERERKKTEALASFVQAIKPGTVLHGVGKVSIDREPTSSHYFIEILGFSPSAATFTFGLRNDGDWANLRKFAAQYEFDSEANMVRVTGRSARRDAVEHGGTLVGFHDDVTIEFQYSSEDPHQLAPVPSTRHATFRVSVVADEKLEALRREAYQFERVILDGSKMGDIYYGTIRKDTLVFPVVMHFVKPANNARRVDVRLESARWENRARMYQVTSHTNQYEERQHRLILAPTGPSADDRAEDLLSDKDHHTILLNVSQDGTMSGTTENGPYHGCHMKFERRDAAWYSRFRTERREAIDVSLARVKKGSSYSGLFTGSEQSGAERVRLVVTHSDHDGAMVVMNLISLDNPSRACVLTGTYDPVTEVLVATSLPSKTTEYYDCFYAWRQHAEWTCYFRDDELVATGAGNEVVTCRPSSQTSSESAHDGDSTVIPATSAALLDTPFQEAPSPEQVEPPRSLGCYVFTAGQWQRMTGSTGSINALEQVGGGLFGALSGRDQGQTGAKFAPFRFKDPSPMNTLPANELTFCFRGTRSAMPPAVADELAHLPPVETARVTVEGSKRLVRMERAAAGVARAHRDDRIEAEFHENARDLVVFSISETAVPGSYVIFVDSDHVYEFVTR